MAVSAALAWLWPGITFGTALALLGTWAGWLIGRYRSWLIVRWIAWWIGSVVRPLVIHPSWARRSTFIFLNNIAILGLLVAIGEWPAAAIAGAASLGVSLGIALRVIGQCTWGFSAPSATNPSGARLRAFRVGIALNLLEPPAIALALGIAIARGTTPLSAMEAWTLFAYGVVPAMLLAAAGEGLWIGAGINAATKPRSHEAT